MLQRALGISPDQASYHTVCAILASGEYESLVLDFKRALPDQPGRLKAAKAVSAFANSSGGVLIYGAGEENDRYTALCSVDLGVPADKLLRAVTALVTPRVPGLLGIPVEDPEAPGQGLFLLVVPPSPLAPHCVYSGKTLEYYARHGRESVPMAEHEVAQAYRARTTRWAETDETAGRTKHHIDQAWGRSARVWLTVTPLLRRGRVYQTGREGCEHIEAARSSGALSDIANGSSYWYPATRFRRIEVSRSRYGTPADGSEFVVLMDSGALGIAYRLSTGDCKQSEYPGQETAFIPPAWTWFPQLIEFAVTGLTLTQYLWKRLEVAGEAVLNYGLDQFGGAGWCETHHSRPTVTRLCTEDMATNLEINSADLDLPGTRERLAATIMGDLRSGFGFSGDQPLLDSEGHLMTQFAGGYAGRLAEWIRSKGMGAASA